MDYGLYTEKVYQDFGYYIDEVKVKIINALMNAKLQGKVIVGFGASITCTTLMNEFSIDKYFDFLVDDNASKQGLYSPHMHIPVHSPNFMKINKPDVLVVLAWRFADDIRERYPEYFDSAECIIIPLPVFDSESSC